MNKSFIMAVATALICTVAFGAKKEKLAIAGSFADNIIIIDKATGNVEWSHPLPFDGKNGGECNSINITPDGNVLISYKKGAQLINRNGNVIWNFTRENESQEVQTAVQIPGGFLLGICGSPAKFIELDKNGKKVRETTYDTGLKDSHSQFRQVRKAQNGNYLIPGMGTGNLLEINRNGEKVNEFKAGEALFAVEELPNGNLLISGATGVAEHGRTSGTVIKQVLKGSIEGYKFDFPTQSLRFRNGNTMLTNWQGHDENVNTQIVEIDKNGKVVWTFDNKAAIKFVSAIYPFSE